MRKKTSYAVALGAQMGAVRLISIAFLSALAGCRATSDGSGESREKAATTTNHLDLADLAEPAQPMNVIFSQSFVDGVPVAGAVAVQAVPTVKTAQIVPKPDGESTSSLKSRDKIARELREQVAQLSSSGRGDDVIPVLVTFSENVKIPRFPRLDASVPRSDPTNTARLQRATLLVNAITAQRESGYATKEAELIANNHARSLERFWITNALRVELPASEIVRLSARQDVVSLDPVVGGGLVGTMTESRALINSDPYFNVGTLTNGYIGVIDSGVITNGIHDLLTGQIDYKFDCVNGGTNCNSSFNPGFSPWDTLNHGTGVSAIITGTNALGDGTRGVTTIHVDSLKVTAPWGIDGAGMGRAYQQAVAIGDWSTNASFFTGGDENSFGAAVADGAFDAGMVVIAAAANSGPGWGTIGCPGSAHKALAVGAIDADDSYVNGTRTVLSFSSRGPALDARYKPDLIAPTNVTTASNSSTGATMTFGGTSGASPHVTAAATLWMNWVDGGSRSTEPGQFYSDLIAFGGGAGGGTMFDNVSGSGLLTMLTNGYWYHAKTSVTNGVDLDFPFAVASGVTSIDAAIWWPESIGGGHDDIDLLLVDPSGVEVATSLSSTSIFEKVHWNTTQSGTWKVRVRGFSVVSSHDVYWSAMIHQ